MRRGIFGILVMLPKRPDRFHRAIAIASGSGPLRVIAYRTRRTYNRDRRGNRPGRTPARDFRRRSWWANGLGHIMAILTAKMCIRRPVILCGVHCAGARGTRTAR